MSKERESETGGQRSKRLEKIAQDRVENAVAEGKSLDAAVRRSIELHGA